MIVQAGQVEWFLAYGYIGVFVASFIGCAPLFFSIPYALVIYFAGMALDPLIVTVVSAVGASLGEVVSYSVGYFGGKLLSEERKKRAEYLLEATKRYWGPLIALFAATPLPDDLILVPLGMMRYDVRKVFAYCLPGKLLMCAVLAYGGFATQSLIFLFIQPSSWVFSVICAAITVIGIIIMLKVDWMEVLKEPRVRKLAKKVLNRRNTQ